MSLAIWSAAFITVIALIGIPLRLAVSPKLKSQTLSGITAFLLVAAGVFSGFATLIALAAAAWGMDTHLPWGFGVYQYLLPALSLPSFLLLLIAPVSILSRALWFLTLATGIAWYFAARAEDHLLGRWPMERLGMFFNAFTLLLIMISILVQLASLCRSKQQRDLEAKE